MCRVSSEILLLLLSTATVPHVWESAAALSVWGGGGEGGREGVREGGSEGGWVGGREGGWEGGREGGWEGGGE